jgi:FtsZ-binding cell division protein ZapB
MAFLTLKKTFNKIKDMLVTRRKYSRIIIFILILAASTQVSQSDSREDIDNARQKIESWVETKHIISKEKQDWELGREMLNERISLVQNEIESLREKISQAQESIGDADKKRMKLVEENDKLKSTSDKLGDIVAKLESSTVSLDKKLPDPLRELVKPYSQSIPKSSNETELSLSIRFQNIIGLVNAVNKFNNEISLNSEVRDLPNGDKAEVTTMYVGLGQAYYVGANNSIAGVGLPSENGWVWESDDKVADKIAEAIKILNNESVASYVPLPIKIK